MQLSEWTQIHTHILQLEQEGLVTRTFRRLDPDRQETILTAILDEAIAKGPTALNIKEVAERAGVSVGSLYTYFLNRDGLLTFAIELCVRYLTDMMNAYRPYFVDLPLEQALRAYIAGGVEWGRTQVGLIQFFTRAAYHGDPDLAERVVRPIADVLRQTVHEMLVRAAERGEIRDDVDLEATARVLHGLTIVAGDSQILPFLNTYFQVTDEGMPPERALDALVDLVHHGISRSSPEQ